MVSENEKALILAAISIERLRIANWILEVGSRTIIKITERIRAGTIDPHVGLGATEAISSFAGEITEVLVKPRGKEG